MDILTTLGFSPPKVYLNWFILVSGRIKIQLLPAKMYILRLTSSVYFFQNCFDPQFIYTPCYLDPKSTMEMFHYFKCNALFYTII